MDPREELEQLLRGMEGPTRLGMGEYFDPRGITLGHTPSDRFKRLDNVAEVPEPVLILRSLYLHLATMLRPAILARLRDRVFPFYLAYREGRDGEVFADYGDGPAPTSAWKHAQLMWLEWSRLGRADHRDDFALWLLAELPVTLEAWRQLGYEQLFMTPLLTGHRRLSMTQLWNTVWRSRLKLSVTLGAWDPTAMTEGEWLAYARDQWETCGRAGFEAAIAEHVKHLKSEAEAKGLQPTPRLYSISQKQRAGDPSALEQGSPLRHLEWTVERRVLQRSPAEIARRHRVRNSDGALSAETVARAVRRTERFLGMDPLRGGRRAR